MQAIYMIARRIYYTIEKNTFQILIRLDNKRIMKIRILYIAGILLSLSTFGVAAQTIDVQLPYYAGRDYYFCLLKGSKQDTIATGRLNSKGKAAISLPENYRGVGRFSVREYAKIWNIIVNGNEKVFMSEPDSVEANPSFNGSVENNFLLDAFTRQNKIIEEYGKAIDPNLAQPLIFPSPEKRVENDYLLFRKQINDNPLYAARIIEILNCLTGVGSSFNISQEDILTEQREFITRKVSFEDLYTSGFWQPIFDSWIQMTSANDSLLLDDSRYMLERCGNDIPMRREVTQTIIRTFSKYGKDYLLAELGTEYLTMPLNGQLAPEIKVGGTSFLPKNSLIIFYETGCGSCHYELEQLKSKYKLLSDNNIRIISIAADIGREVHEETSAKLPWTDKFCDFKGFDGENFRNYGIVGTPTYILTDREGIVRGRYAQLKELVKD
ncbi:hypothetical protein D0T56_14485 [Dysgonomonas sp. 520]|nr:hypothetical protein [Dysgonomonas sp. 520]